MIGVVLIVLMMRLLLWKLLWAWYVDGGVEYSRLTGRDEVD
jgi:hypothetical protein